MAVVRSTTVPRLPPSGSAVVTATGSRAIWRAPRPALSVRSSAGTPAATSAGTAAGWSATSQPGMSTSWASKSSVVPEGPDVAAVAPLASARQPFVVVRAPAALSQPLGPCTSSPVSTIRPR